MSERPMSDEQISRALRVHLPDRASADLRDRVLAQAAITAQQRPVPSVIAGLADADPIARRKALLVAAAFLIGLTLAVSAGVGAWLQSQQKDDPFTLGAPPDVDRYVAEAYTGLVDLPALRFTVLEIEGTKGLWSYNGAGVVRHDHFSTPNGTEPEQFRLFSGDQMAERANMNGTPVWVVYSPQPTALGEIARATGLNTHCEDPWTYVALEYLIGRPTHHVACGPSSMWLDVEVRIPLRSVNVQGGDLPTVEFVVLEFEVAPQPPELFEAPADLAVVSDLEYRCATEPPCEAPATPFPSDPPAATPPPAPGAYAVPSDLDAFVAEVVARYATLGALEMTIATTWSPGDPYWRHFFDGAGNSRGEWHYDDTEPPTIYLNRGGTLYESYGLTEDARTLWLAWDEPQKVSVPSFGMSRRCALGWEHHGFDLVADRAAHHLVCEGSSYWVDVEWLLGVRSEYLVDPLGNETITEELRELRFIQPPAELFVLPPDAVVCTNAIRSGRCRDQSGNPVTLPNPTVAPDPSG